VSLQTSLRLDITLSVLITYYQCSFRQSSFCHPLWSRRQRALNCALSRDHARRPMSSAVILAAKRAKISSKGLPELPLLAGQPWAERPDGLSCLTKMMTALHLAIIPPPSHLHPFAHGCCAAGPPAFCLRGLTASGAVLIRLIRCRAQVHESWSLRVLNSRARSVIDQGSVRLEARQTPERRPRLRRHRRRGES
jgi:hypothetical protein